MLIFYKNKGILIIVYLIASLIGSAALIGILQRNCGGIFSKITAGGVLGIALLVAAIWTYLTKDDFYKDREGNKKKMDTENSFFFIQMKYWVYIFLGLSITSFLNAMS